MYPAAAFAPMVAARGVPVAEFNLEETQVTGSLKYVIIMLYVLLVVSEV